MRCDLEQLKKDRRAVERATMQAKSAAEYIGLSYWKLLEMVKAGEIKHIRVGRRVLFRRATLDAWMAEQEKSSIQKSETAGYGKIRRLV